jgi:hypothetical protein
MRTLFAAVLMLAAAPVVWSQGQSAEGQAAADSKKQKEKDKEKEKEKAAAAKPPRKPGPSYTDEDLKRARESGRGNVVFLPSPPADAAGSSGDENEPTIGQQMARERDAWREQADGYRQAIAAAEERVRTIENRLGELRSDVAANPGDLMDPSRLQKRDAERERLLKEIEVAKAEVVAARKALDDFVEEARKKGIPPSRLQP